MNRPLEGEATARMAPKGSSSTDLLELSHDQLETFFLSMGEARFRADQVFRHLHARNVRELEEMTDLARPLRARLSTVAHVGGLTLLDVLVDPDTTRKLILRTSDGHIIEAVLIPMEVGETLCVSSQIGCDFGCAFCLTGRTRRVRDLTMGEIVDQVAHARRLSPESKGHKAPGNIVFMGMGEPLQNYDAVVGALRVLQHPLGADFSSRRITVSTAGLVPGIRRLTEEPDLVVNLAVSLNATTDEQRRRIMPIAKAYPMDVLLEALRAFKIPQRRRLTVEYVMLAGVNDAPADARRLVRALHGLRAKVNLLPHNPWPGSPFRRPEEATVQAFQSALQARGMTATVRQSRGRTIGAACGLLTPPKDAGMIYGEGMSND